MVHAAVADPPGWFWKLLDDARPNLSALSRGLEQLPRDKLVEFVRIYREASEQVCDYWLGPTVDGVSFSEDSTEDLCNWIVARGESYWRQAVALGGKLEPVVREYWRERRDPSASWSAHVDNPTYRGYQSPGFIALAVFRARFDEDLQS